MIRGRAEDGQAGIVFPDPIDPLVEISDWNHDQFPIQHIYTDQEIVVVPDPHGYRWHLPHGPTGVETSERAAFSTARRVVQHVDPIVHYGETIGAARTWGNRGTTVPKFIRWPERAVRRMCVQWLAIIASACLAELKERAPTVWAKVMLAGQDGDS